MFKMQYKQAHANLLCKRRHIITALLIVLTSFNVTWAVFDVLDALIFFVPGEYGLGDTIKNYNNGVSDGSYIYFNSQHVEGSGVHEEIPMYDSNSIQGTCWDPDECAGQPFGDATCDGDANNVGTVNLGDLIALKKAWGQTAPWSDRPFCCADFNHDGAVNLGDMMILKKNWGRTGFTPATENHMCPQ